MAAEARFRAMGSDVHVIVVGGLPRLLDVAGGSELLDRHAAARGRVRSRRDRQGLGRRPPGPGAPGLRGQLGACANVGGDLRVEGDAPRGSWVVAIEHPMGAKPAATIALRSGAVATTSRMRRAWGPDSDRRHHLIDPSTGHPAMSGLASATVIAAEAWHAEVVAKAAFLAGVSEGLFVLASTGTEGLLVDDRGTVYPSFGFDRFTGKDGAPSAAG